MKLKIKEQTYQRKFPENFKQGDINLIKQELSRKIPKIEKQEFNNVLVISEQIVLKSGKSVKNIYTKADKPNFKLLLTILRRKRINLRKAIFLTDTWSTNYFHWFTDTLPRLLLAEKHFAEIPILLPAYFDRFPYILESLKAFDKSKIIWLHDYQKAKVSELIYIPHTAPTGNYNEEIIREIREKLRQFFKLDTIEPSKKTMISRQDAHGRRIINYNEVKKQLTEENIHEIIFEKKTWQQQVEIAANSKLLIGVHGAGLTNILFMSEGTKVLELRRKDDSFNNCYFSLASALNIDYYYLLCEVDDYKKLTQQNNFNIPNEEFYKIVKLIK